jgi:hypothetical protein
MSTIRQEQIELTSDTEPKTETLQKIQRLTIAMRAAKLGSRPPVMYAMTGLPHAKVREIYREVVGSAPIKGQLPSDTTFYISDVNRHLESVWLLQTYRMLSQKEDSHYEQCECMFMAFEMYLSRFNSPAISFDRFFLLVRHTFFGNEITLCTCNDCGSQNVAVKRWDQRKSVRCPICYLSSQS